MAMGSQSSDEGEGVSVVPSAVPSLDPASPPPGGAGAGRAPSQPQLSVSSPPSTRKHGAAGGNGSLSLHTRRGGRKTRHSDSVVVAVRMRPPLARERGTPVAVAMKDNSCCVQAPRAAGKSKLKTVTLDHCAPHDTTQEQLYQILGRGLVDKAWRGYNSSLIAYGQTGSGKTYSVFGPPDVPPAELYNPSILHRDAGIIPRVFTDIFSRVEVSEGEYVIEVAMMEIYLERVFDLLRGRAQMDIRGTNELGFFAEKVTKRRVHTYNDVVQVLRDGNANKVVASTALNATSSRAHTLLEIYVRKLVSDSKVRANSAKIVIVDLAGSENVKQSEVEGELRQQASIINLSLMELGRVVEQVVDREIRKALKTGGSAATSPQADGSPPTPESKCSRYAHDETGSPAVRSSIHDPTENTAAGDAVHDRVSTQSRSRQPSQAGGGHAHHHNGLISFRGSALTKLLKESVGGNSKATILVTISPSQRDVPQTLSALRFADRAKHLRNHAHFNEGAFSDNQTRLKIVNEEHKRLLQRHKFEQKYHELINKQATYEENAADLRRQQKLLVTQIAHHKEMTDAERAELKERWARLTSEETRVRDTQRATTLDIERVLKVQAKLLREKEAEKTAERSEKERLEQVVTECLEEVERTQAQCVNLKEYYERQVSEAEARAVDAEARAALGIALADQKATTRAEAEMARMRLEHNNRQSDLALQQKRSLLVQEHLTEQVAELQGKVAWYQKQLEAGGGAGPRRGNDGPGGSGALRIDADGDLSRESTELMNAFARERERLVAIAERESDYYKQQITDLQAEMETIRSKHEAVAGEHIARLNQQVQERIDENKAMAAEREVWLKEKKELVLEKRALEEAAFSTREELRRMGDRAKQLDDDERRGWEEKHLWRVRCQDLAAALRAVERTQRDVLDAVRSMQGDYSAALKSYSGNGDVAPPASPTTKATGASRAFLEPPTPPPTTANTSASTRYLTPTATIPNASLTFRSSPPRRGRGAGIIAASSISSSCSSVCPSSSLPGVGAGVGHAAAATAAAAPPAAPSSSPSPPSSTPTPASCAVIAAAVAATPSPADDASFQRRKAPPPGKGIREIEGQLLRALKHTVSGFVHDYERERIDGEKVWLVHRDTMRALKALEARHEVAMAQLEARLKVEAKEREDLLAKTADATSAGAGGALSPTSVLRALRGGAGPAIQRLGLHGLFKASPSPPLAPSKTPTPPCVDDDHDDVYLSGLSPTNTSHRSSPSPSPSIIPTIVSPQGGAAVHPTSSTLVMLNSLGMDSDAAPESNASDDGSSDAPAAGDGAHARNVSPLSSLRDSFASIPSYFALNQNTAAASPDMTPAARPSTPTQLLLGGGVASAGSPARVSSGALALTQTIPQQPLQGGPFEALALASPDIRGGAPARVPPSPPAPANQCPSPTPLALPVTEAVLGLGGGGGGDAGSVRPPIGPVMNPRPLTCIAAGADPTPPPGPARGPAADVDAMLSPKSSRCSRAGGDDDAGGVLDSDACGIVKTETATSALTLSSPSAAEGGSDAEQAREGAVTAAAGVTRILSAASSPAVPPASPPPPAPPAIARGQDSPTTTAMRSRSQPHHQQQQRQQQPRVAPLRNIKAGAEGGGYSVHHPHHHHRAAAAADARSTTNTSTSTSTAATAVHVNLGATGDGGLGRVSLSPDRLRERRQRETDAFRASMSSALAASLGKEGVASVLGGGGGADVVWVGAAKVPGSNSPCARSPGSPGSVATPSSPPPLPSLQQAGVAASSPSPAGPRPTCDRRGGVGAGSAHRAASPPATSIASFDVTSQAESSPATPPPAAGHVTKAGVAIDLSLPLSDAVLLRRASFQSSESERLVTSRPSDVVGLRAGPSGARDAASPQPAPQPRVVVTASPVPQDASSSIRRRWEERKKTRGVG